MYRVEQLTVNIPAPGRRDALAPLVYIRAYCTERRCLFLVQAEEVNPECHPVLRHFPDAACPTHRLTGLTFPLEGTSLAAKIIERSRHIYVDTDWPKCLHCGKRVLPCHSCGRLVCSIRHTGDGLLDVGHITVETCPLCHQAFMRAG